MTGAFARRGEVSMSSTPDEAEVLRRAIDGDTAAVQELLLLHYDRVAQRLNGKIPADLQGTLTVEDVLQEAFADVVQRISSFTSRGEGSFLGWIYTIAEHRLIDLARAARAAKRGGGRAQIDGAVGEGSTVGDLLTLLAAHEHTPSRSIAGHEAVGAVQAALSGLKDEYREVLHLRYFEGLSVAQTAERMSRTEPAIHMLCHRAVAQLRDHLGNASRFLSR